MRGCGSRCRKKRQHTHPRRAHQGGDLDRSAHFDYGPETCGGCTQRGARVPEEYRGEREGLRSPQRSFCRAAQTVMNPPAMNVAIRFFTASKSSDLQMPPDNLSMRPVRASVRSNAPVTK